MVDSSADRTPGARTAPGDAGISRQQTAIGFPYIPLHDVVIMVLAVEARGHRCLVEELAIDLKQQMSSGAFRSRLSAGRLFGVIETVRRDVSLTELGRRTCYPDTQPEALAEAFLNVPLYQKIYEQFAGNKLPPDQGIEGVMRRLGVPHKQVQKARQVFSRSAEMAGYFGSGRDRLIRPPGSKVAVEPSSAPAPRERPGAGAEAVPMGDHPLIAGLVAKLPAEGKRFSPQQRERWLLAAKVNLELIYATDDDPDPETLAAGGVSEQPSSTPRGT
jgi:hypothetical protein